MKDQRRDGWSAIHRTLGDLILMVASMNGGLDQIDGLYNNED